MHDLNLVKLQQNLQDVPSESGKSALLLWYVADKRLTRSYKVPIIGFHHLFVPHTRTRLNYVFLNTIKINSTIVADAIGNFTKGVQATAKVRDGTIPSDRFFQQNQGLTLCAHSVRKNHLTWGVLGAALKGLGSVLGTAGSVENYKAAWFDIFDSDWGNVGRGILSDNNRRHSVLPGSRLGHLLGLLLLQYKLASP